MRDVSTISFPIPGGGRGQGAAAGRTGGRGLGRAACGLPRSPLGHGGRQREPRSKTRRLRFGAGASGLWSAVSGTGIADFEAWA
eukprot:14132919-Alexandrium_andersonii.AAC.1